MPNVTLVTVEDLVNKALEQAPRFAAMETVKEAAVVKSTPAIALADTLDKLASELEREEVSTLTTFKSAQQEKRSSMSEIIRTYAELETSR